jgi:hypothetical protein
MGATSARRSARRRSGNDDPSGNLEDAKAIPNEFRRSAVVTLSLVSTMKSREQKVDRSRAGLGFPAHLTTFSALLLYFFAFGRKNRGDKI